MWTLQLTVPDQPFYCHAVRHLLPAFFCCCSGNNLYEPSDSTLILFFYCYFHSCIVSAICFYLTQIVPCNVGLAFNELVADTVTFDALGGPYTMQVEKGRKITQIGGDDWDRFIARMRLSGGELICFSFRRDRPRISVIYLNLIPDSEDEVHEEEDGAD